MSISPGTTKTGSTPPTTWGEPRSRSRRSKQVLGVDVTEYLEIGFQSFEETDRLARGRLRRRRPAGTRTEPSLGRGDLYPGYQLLDGADALLFARYRFDRNSDFGRMARQQRILAAIREQAMGWDLPTKLPGLIGELLGSTTTNLSAAEMTKLAYWLVKLDGSRIRQTMITGSGQMIDGKAVIVADQATLTEAVTAHLTPPGEQTTGATGGDLLLAAADTQNLLTTTSTATAATTVPDSEMWEFGAEERPVRSRGPEFHPRRVHLRIQDARGRGHIRHKGRGWDRACRAHGLPLPG